MKNKSGEKEYVIRTSKVDNEGISYNYSLLENRSEQMPSYGLPLYTLKIEMTDAEGISTEVTAKDVFRDVGKAIRFYDKIVKNLATPIDLAYVIEDEIG